MGIKNNLELFIKKHSGAVINTLGLSKWKIDIRVCKLKDNKLDNSINRPLYGAAVFGIKGRSFYGRIEIYIDNHNTLTEAIFTLIHELLHLRLYRLRTLVIDDDTKKLIKEEESVVSDIEGLFKYMKRKNVYPARK